MNPRLGILTGDLPNYFHTLLLPKWFAKWFCLPKVELDTAKTVFEITVKSPTLPPPGEEREILARVYVHLPSVEYSPYLLMLLDLAFNCSFRNSAF